MFDTEQGTRSTIGNCPSDQEGENFPIEFGQFDYSRLQAVSFKQQRYGGEPFSGYIHPIPSLLQLSAGRQPRSGTPQSVPSCFPPTPLCPAPPRKSVGIVARGARQHLSPLWRVGGQEARGPGNKPHCVCHCASRRCAPRAAQCAAQRQQRWWMLRHFRGLNFSTRSPLAQ